MVAGSEEGAKEAKQALLKAVGKVTDVVSSLGFSWWQGGPPHTQSLKDLHWVSARARSLLCETFHLIFYLSFRLQVIETLLFSTFVSWKAFFPLVRDDCNCTYTFITGASFRHISSLCEAKFRV